MNSISAKNLSTAPPILTGESRRDWALWQLSCILAEIAEQGIWSKNDVDSSMYKQTQQKMNNGKVFPLIEDIDDV